MKWWLSLIIFLSTALLIWGNACGRRFQPKIQKVTLSSTKEDELFPNTFSISRNAVFILPYTAIEAKIKSLIPALTEDLFSQIRSIRYEMGDFDFSKGIAPELSWNQNKMDAWMTGLLPICQSTQYMQQYPFPNNALKFMALAYGRNNTDDDSHLINELNQLNTNSITTTDKSTILCLLVFSSIEFVGN